MEKRGPQSSQNSQGPKTELTFKPLTSGLGFHPFSEGLPYASNDKAPMVPTRTLPKRPDAMNGAMSSALGESEDTISTFAASLAASATGTGATAAGSPTFAKPSAQSPSPVLPSRPRGSQGSTQSSEPFAGIANPSVARPSYQQPQHSHYAAQAQAAAQQSSLIEQMAVQHYGFGYCLKRVFAYLFDLALTFSVGSAAMAGVLWKQNLNPELLKNPSILGVSLLFLATFSWALATAQEVVFGTTAGKRLFGLVLHGTTTAIFLRSLLFLLSLAPAGLGILWALLHPKKRCWHDMALDLQPDEIARL